MTERDFLSFGSLLSVPWFFTHTTFRSQRALVSKFDAAWKSLLSLRSTLMGLGVLKFCYFILLHFKLNMMRFANFVWNQICLDGNIEICYVQHQPQIFFGWLYYMIVWLKWRFKSLITLISRSHFKAIGLFLSGKNIKLISLSLSIHLKLYSRLLNPFQQCADKLFTGGYSQIGFPAYIHKLFMRKKARKCDGDQLP